MNELFKFLPRQPRWVNKIVANAFGYFWLPCDICGEEFAGFEWLTNLDNDHTIYRRGQTGKGVCYKLECGQKAKEMSDYNPYYSRITCRSLARERANDEIKQR